MRGSERIFHGLKAFAKGFFIGVPVYVTVIDNFCTVCEVEGVSMQVFTSPSAPTCLV
jgi:hypothetical protein